MSDLKKSKSIKNQPLVVSIYTLADPRTPQNIRYVGKTIMKPEQRLRSHLNKVKYRKCHNSYWIRSLLNEGLKPLINVVEIVEEATWIEKEMFYIQKYQNEGFSLTNHTLGGEGTHGYKHSEEFKASRRKPIQETYRYKQLKFHSKEERNKDRSERMKLKYAGKTPFPYNPEHVKKAVQQSIAKTSKEVLELSDGIVIASYKSVADCARLTGLVDSNIARVCRGISKHTGNRVFTYKSSIT